MSEHDGMDVLTSCAVLMAMMLFAGASYATDKITPLRGMCVSGRGDCLPSGVRRGTTANAVIQG